jgi:SAM-dependent methyltransferase
MYRYFREGIGGSEASRTHVRDFVRPFPRARILDIGCGPGSLLDFLPDDVRYVGCDVSSRYIAYAANKYGRRAKFFCSDAAALPRSDEFDIVLATGVLHHLNDSDANALFNAAADRLAAGGRLVTLDNAYVDGQSKAARWIISMDRGRHVRTPTQYEDLARARFPTIRSFIRHDLLRIPYTHFIMECSR